MRPIGFSTGSLAFGQFQDALHDLYGSGTTAIELSALRGTELGPLIASLDTLDLTTYRYVAVHAPSWFAPGDEGALIDQLAIVAKRDWPIVLHPDAIHDFDRWRALGALLLIENMDKRKRIGRTSEELSSIFALLPKAGLCFDIAHARQVDPSMAEAYGILRRHGRRIRQIHISEVSSSSKHVRISRAAVSDYREVAFALPSEVPVILETPVTPLEYRVELEMACEALEIAAEEVGALS